MPPGMLRRATLMLFVAASLGLASGCTDECQELAERVCECEQTLNEREACRIAFQAQERNRPDPTDEQREACGQALETCTCAALEENETFRCGFTRDEGAFTEDGE